MNIVEELKEFADLFNNYVTSSIDIESDNLSKASFHLLNSGGKRIRPFLTCKTFELFDDNIQNILPIATSCELIHNFTLLHDDIMDNDLTRHGVPTAHSIYGIPIAILSGDILFAIAFSHISNNSKLLNSNVNRILKIINVLSEASITICNGQSDDLIMSNEKQFRKPESYFNMISKKTAALFEASCKIGCIAGNGTSNDEKSLTNFGKNFGIAFQMIDDVIGVVGKKNVTGKPVGEDIVQGKKTYMISLALDSMNSEQKNLVLKIFGKKQASANQITDAVNIISNTGVADIVREKARIYTQNAVDSLDPYKDAQSYSSLINLTEFLIKRNI